MISPRSVALANAVIAALATNLAYAQPLTYQGQQGESLGSTVEEQMPPASEHPQKGGIKRARLKPKATNTLRAPPPQPLQSSTEAANAQEPCAGRDDVLGTSRTISIGAPNGLEVGLKTYPQTLKLEDHEVVLTFDDGPLPETTGKVLDALKAQCVKATFFLIGQNAAAHPQLVRRQIREGHTVGHHTWSHPSITMRGLSDEAARIDIAKGIAADERAAYGEAARPAETPHVPFFRFPGFADTKPLLSWLASQKIAVFGADFWASDWLEMTPEAELKLIMSRLDAAGRGIILFHDSRPSTAAMMPDFLRELKAHHYRVVHIEPGDKAPELEQAPPSWTSETEATVNRVLSKLLSRAKIDAARRKPQMGNAGKVPESAPEGPQ
ncbi:MAG: peptidoglycan-N-acetylglucosamine deacetylase [Methylobacteriaceae bacterium]|nr:peptidoglycan-N-acetylglucosamine deacetylase [Methylobacteriaceae bacterium]